MAGTPDNAELSTLVKLTQRRRVREMEDGRVVLEEQDVLFTEKKMVWPGPGPDQVAARAQAD